MKRTLVITSFAALAGVFGCSSAGTKHERVTAVETTVDTPSMEAGNNELTNTLTAELEGWNERLDDLKARSLQTRNKDQFKLLSDNIVNMEKTMNDARQNFLDMRLAESDGSRSKYEDKINGNLEDLRRTYNKLPAE
jgi:hypothetical protein